jgi:Domain of unknown function DUF1828
MRVDPCAAIAQALGERFECKALGERIRVRTPLLYPDGGIVDVFVRERNGQIAVTDLGEALGWLRQQTIGGKRSPKQHRLLQDICLTLGVELFRGQLIARSNNGAALSDLILRVGQAAVRAADLWFTTRTRSLESVTDEVADYLQDQDMPYERGVKLAGRSGRDWMLDFQVLAPARSALVFVLASGARAGARRVAEHVVAGWHDLSQFRVGPQAARFISLFDDTSDVWSEEDFRLVESISEIGRWTRPDEFIELVRAA